MTFRARIAVSAAAAVALTVVAASILLYLVAREQIRAPVDEALEARAAEIALQQLAVIPGQGGADYLAVKPEFGEARGYVQLVRGGRIRPRASQAGARASRRRARALGGRKRGRCVLGRRDRRRHAHSRVHVRVWTRCRGSGRSPAERGRRVAPSHRPLPAPHRSRRRGHCGRPRARRRARSAHAGARADGDGGARERDAGPLRAHRGGRERRAEPARGKLQRDARRAGGVHSRPAAARRRRFARAPNAPHERAHEHRGARG